MTGNNQSPLSDSGRITRRGILGVVALGAVGAPVARILVLKAKDDPLPKIATPEPVFVDGWLLDSSDTAQQG
jgi:hypothetical protein